jgi:hypothetical protein
MFGTNSFARSLAVAVIGLAGLAAVGGSASAAVLTVEDVGFVAPTATGTLVQRVDLSTAGVATISKIILTDNSGGFGGDPGVFSGYDLDAVFLDGDGDIATTGDQVAFSSFAFTGGGIRDGAGSNQVPSAPNNIGTYFGTNNAGQVVPFGSGNSLDATLHVFDGVNSASTLNANGFLSMGDGGQLVLTFADIAVGSGLYLIFGEVGGQGEKLQVEVSQVPLPGAVWLLLSGIAALFGASLRRSTTTA